MKKARESGPFTFGLIVACVVAYVLKPWIFDFMALGPAWWVTYAFMHASISHLVLNMVMLGFIGPVVERRLGSLRFGVIYFGAAIFAAGVIRVMDPLAVTVGASGGLFALMVILVAISPDKRAPLALLGANVVYTFIADGVSVWGHLGGVAAGLIAIPWSLKAR